MAQSKHNLAEMMELRAQGLTYEEIGKRFGLSRQRIHGLIGSMRTRKSNTDIEKIAYEGIYQMFVEDPKMTFAKLARMMSRSKAPGHARTEHIRRMVTKREDGRFSIDDINNLLRAVGRPYEEVFRVRENHLGNEV
jgi:transcriptional regulator with XRE-family HTH domain